jgi:hypothetical protein
MSEDAKLTIGADASAVERAFSAAKSAVREAAAELASSMAGAARSVVGSFTDVAVAQGKINFASQHAAVREFELATTRLATAAGRDLSGVQQEFNRVGVAIGKRPAEVAAWASEVGKLTYNFDSAGKAIEGLSGLAASTGRDVEEYRGLAVVLGSVGKVAGDTTRAVGLMAAQADALGVQGGVAAFADQIEALGGTISLMSINSERDLGKVTALAATLGKGLGAQAAGRVQQQALGALTADPLRWERFLGHSVLDKSGHVQDPTQVLKEITAKAKARYGADAQRVLRLNFGAETGSALFNADFSSAERAAGLTPSTKPKTLQSALIGSAAGQREVAKAQLDVSSQKLLDSSSALGRAADALQKFAASNPFASTLGTAVTESVAGFAVGKAGTLAKGLFQGGSKGAINVTQGLAGVGAVGAGLAVAGAGALGVGAGYLAGKGLLALDEKYGKGASDRAKLSAMDAETAKLKAERDRVRAERGLPKLGAGGDAKDLQDAVKAGFKEAKITIVNMTGGPIEVAEGAAQSPAAGSQAGGG